MGRSLRSRENNVAKMIGMSSREGFLVCYVFVYVIWVLATRRPFSQELIDRSRKDESCERAFL